MKIKTKIILSGILILNLAFPIGYMDSINSHAINENEIIDKWETRTPMPTTRIALASAVVNGKIYCIGGYDSSYLNIVEVYDPETDKWETKTPMPTPRSSFSIAVINNKIYCVGGVTSTSYLNIMEVYDPETDSWETKTPMSTPRGNFSIAVANNKIYCIGGSNGVTSRVNIVEVYNPETDSWETKTPMPTARGGLSSEVVDGKIYCVGGVTSTRYLNIMEVYDPETDSWETKTPMSTLRGNFSIAVANNKIYCIGGSNTSLLNIVEVYDPKTDSWETKTPMSMPRSMFSIAVVNNKVYCIGGRIDSSYTDIVEVYIPNINAPEYRAEQSVIVAQNSKELNDIENARDLVNQLEDKELKTKLQHRLDAIFPNITLDIKNATTNVDIYIKSENMLLMNLSTNSITLDDYSGLDEIEQENAVEISINSSLPYQLNAYLLDEMYNSDRTKKIDMNRLQVKDNTEDSYSEFTDINEKLILKDACESGNDKSHSISFKLKGGNAYESDIYKTVIKFEAEQK